jgi:hypothetical protein
MRPSAACWATDKEVKGMKDTNTYVWGEGY